MKFTLEISCDNAAFGESHDELCEQLEFIIRRILPIADNIFLDESQTTLRDSNGNKVGSAKFETEKTILKTIPAQLAQDFIDAINLDDVSLDYKFHAKAALQKLENAINKY